MSIDNIAASLPKGMKLWTIAVTPIEQAKLQQILAELRSASNYVKPKPPPDPTLPLS